MITAGNTFLIPTPPDYEIKHLYVVVIIVNNNDEAILVNITTKKENSDISCILNIGDHDFIDRESVINYKEAIKPKIEFLKANIQNNKIFPHKPVSADLLKRIQDGAVNSKHMKLQYKKYISY